jgi:predicted porin
MASGPTLADDNAVQLYGTFNLDVERVDAHGATDAGTLPAGSLGRNPTGADVPGRVRVSSNSSNFGIRGTERLGGDLAAFFQVESGVNIDAGNSTLASRNSGVGLKSSWGTAFIGQWDTPYKFVSGAVDPMYFTGIAYTGALIGTPGFGVGPVTNAVPGTSADGRSYANVANASFERRQGNSIQYWSPEIARTTVRIAWSVNENKSSGADGVTRVNPYIVSASIDHHLGPFYAAWSHESHVDYFGLDALVPATQATLLATTPPGSASSRDDGDKLVLRYVTGGTQVGLIAERLRYRKSASPAIPTWYSRYERSAYAVTLVQKVGTSGSIRGLYGVARDGRCERNDGLACDTSGLGAHQLSIGYSNSLSKRTDLYAFYTRVANDERGSYQFANGAGLGAAAGSVSRR